ncbi:MAG: hypothetical protein M3071_06265 [Actinomycetota bacterium]|nr:hypothetical protein [Actinomycetota bacterium]
MVGAVAVDAATPAQVVQADKKAAVSAADQLLGGIVLPAGASRTPTEPTGDAHELAQPMAWFGFAAEVDRHEFWTVTSSPSAVIASFSAHLPAGAKPSGAGSSGSGMTASYSLPALHTPALGQRTLLVDAVTLANGTTGVRADAAVRYSAPRLPNQQVPPQARVLEIAKVGRKSKPLLSITVTKLSRVRRIAALVNSLPFTAASRGAIACPE